MICGVLPPPLKVFRKEVGGGVKTNDFYAVVGVKTNALNAAKSGGAEGTE